MLEGLDKVSQGALLTIHQAQHLSKSEVFQLADQGSSTYRHIKSISKASSRVWMRQQWFLYGWLVRPRNRGLDIFGVATEIIHDMFHYHKPRVWRRRLPQLPEELNAVFIRPVVHNVANEEDSGVFDGLFFEDIVR